MPRDREHIQTNFMDRQAAENAKSGTARSIFMGIGFVALLGFGFAGFQAFQFFSNFDMNSYKRNVSVTLKDPKVVAGKAIVSVEFKNHNAVDISNPLVDYTIANSGGKQLAAGQVKIDGTIPAADSREFENISLSEIQGDPAKLHSDLVNIVVKPNDKLPKGFSARFAGAFDNNGTQLIAALEPLASEAPHFDGTYIALGKAYQDVEDWQSALEKYKKAVEVAPESANAHYHLGVALAHQNQLPEGLIEMKKASELNPSDQTISKTLASFNASSAPAATAPAPAETKHHKGKHKKSR